MKRSHCNLVSLIGVIVLLAFSHAGQAGESNPYIDLSYMRSTVSMAGLEFKPLHAKIKGGYYLQDKIAIELQYADSASESIGGQTLSIDELYGVFLRLDSNVQNRVRIYVLAGQVHSTLTIKGTNTATEKLKDVAFGIGAEEKLQSFENAYITLEYARFISDEMVNMKELSLGIRFDF